MPDTNEIVISIHLVFEAVEGAAPVPYDVHVSAATPTAEDLGFQLAPDALPAERERAPGARSKRKPDGSTWVAEQQASSDRIQSNLAAAAEAERRQAVGAAMLAEAEAEADAEPGEWMKSEDAAKLARRFAHAERHIPELAALAQRLANTGKPFAEIRDRLKADGRRLAVEDPPDADNS